MYSQLAALKSELKTASNESVTTASNESVTNPSLSAVGKALHKGKSWLNLKTKVPELAHAFEDGDERLREYRKKHEEEIKNASVEHAKVKSELVEQLDQRNKNLDQLQVKII